METAIDKWLDQYYEEVEPRDFVRDLFPVGSLEHTGFVGETHDYTGIIVSMSSTEKQQKCKRRALEDGTIKWEPVFEADGTPKMVPVVRRHYLTEEMEILEPLFAGSDFCLMSPITYAGRERSAKNARFAYALAFDVDHIRMKGDLPIGLANLFGGHIERAERIPKPTYVVSSGSGVHLYYVFERPVPLFKNIVDQLQAMKHELTWMIWNEGIVDIGSERDIQFEGIYQGFRLPGTVTKDGRRARVFSYGSKVTIEYLNQFVDHQVTDFSYKSKVTKKDAAILYPEWYQKRVVEGVKGVLHPWAVNRSLYDWWRREILKKATVGHRYYCLMLLATYAMKCSFYDAKKNPQPVTREELESDAYEVMDYFETLTNKEDNHFTSSDVLDALDAFDGEMITYPRNSVEYRAGFELPTNKRNKLKQQQHLYLARRRKEDMKVISLPMKNKEGHPAGSSSQRDAVLKYRREHPTAAPKDCIADTGISKNTVYRWWADGYNKGV